MLVPGQSGANGLGAAPLAPTTAISSDSETATMLPRLMPAMATQLTQLHVHQVRKPLNNIFGYIWDFVPTGLTPPPSLNVEISKMEKEELCLFCILGYSRAHYLFHEKVWFFGRDDKCEGPVTSSIDKILLPIYVLCVSSHFWAFAKANLVLVNFEEKSWDKVITIDPIPGIPTKPMYLKQFPPC